VLVRLLLPFAARKRKDVHDGARRMILDTVANLASLVDGACAGLRSLPRLHCGRFALRLPSGGPWRLLYPFIGLSVF
jgi:hypothetical protein